MTTIEIYDGETTKKYNPNIKDESKIIKFIKSKIGATKFREIENKRINYIGGFGFYKVSESPLKCYDFFVEVEQEQTGLYS